VVKGRVYDVTPYVEDHVGGPESISRLAGLDNTKGFLGKQHPEKVTQMIEEYYIGDLA
jgi:cytochrome b involved in lipid metabolism